MIYSKSLYKLIIGLLIIIAIVITYLLIKFDYYEDLSLSKIQQYNKAVEKYYLHIEKLDSINSLKYSKNDFFYLTEQKGIPEEYGTDYKSFLNWIRERINKINSINNELSMLNKKKKISDTLSDDDFKLHDEKILTDTQKKESKKWKYTPDELNDIGDEVLQDKNEFYNKKFKK